jgi:hypothetical protein
LPTTAVKTAEEVTIDYVEKGFGLEKKCFKKYRVALIIGPS